MITLINFKFTDTSWWFNYIDPLGKNENITFTSLEEAKTFSTNNNLNINFDGCPI